MLLDVTLAVSLSDPGLVVIPTMVTVAVFPAPSVLRVQVTVPSLAGLLVALRVHVHPVPDTDLNTNVEGRVSVTVTVFAADPPLFVATIV
jgi:hypothetical protein